MTLDYAIRIVSWQHVADMNDDPNRRRIEIQQQVMKNHQNWSLCSYFELTSKSIFHVVLTRKKELLIGYLNLVWLYWASVI